MKKFFYSIWAKFLTWFGKIKIATSGLIPVVFYKDEPYFITGYDIFDLLHYVQPGDVLIRGYDNYLDGKFIPDEKGYSHAGIYVGNNEMIHAVSPSVERIHLVDFCVSDRIMLLRPKEGQDQAISKAVESIGKPYDFNYKSDDKRVYCFELISKCYPQSEMKVFTVKKFFGIVKRKCYLAKSIYENPFFFNMWEKCKERRVVNGKEN